MYLTISVKKITWVFYWKEEQAIILFIIIVAIVMEWGYISENQVKIIKYILTIAKTIMSLLW